MAANSNCTNHMGGQSGHKGGSCTATLYTVEPNVPSTGSIMLSKSVVSDFSGLVVSMLVSGTQDRRFKPG
jgi:hypothetical protein